MKLYDDAVTPTRKHPTDAGVDVYAWGDYFVRPHTVKIIETGVAFKIPKNFIMQVWPKSRNDWLIGAGIIDEDYQGQLLIKLVNISNDDLVIRHGDAVAQVILVPCHRPALEEGTYIYSETTERSITGGIVSQLELFDEKPDF
jgi:dUTP pyrophosphatase